MKTLTNFDNSETKADQKCDCFEKNLQIFGLLRDTNVVLSYYCPVCSRRYRYEEREEKENENSKHV